VQRPLATVVIGGLVFSLALSLLALPAMLMLVARHRRPTPPPDGDDPDAVLPIAPPEPGAHP
jgi:hypothetical protein